MQMMSGSNDELFSRLSSSDSTDVCAHVCVHDSATPLFSTACSFCPGFNFFQSKVTLPSSLRKVRYE